MRNELAATANAQPAPEWRAFSLTAQGKPSPERLTTALAAQEKPAAKGRDRRPAAHVDAEQQRLRLPSYMRAQLDAALIPN